MIENIPLICIFAAIILLIVLSAIDLKHMILPDEFNLALVAAGVAFHLLTGYRFLEISDMLWGAAIGAGMLYVIRFFSNRHYGRDTLGLGDVKLLGAAGVWLGVEGVLQAVTIGAFAGLLHGIFYAAYLSHKNKSAFTIRNLTIPAGPGFAVGIATSGGIMLTPYIVERFHVLFS